MNLILRHLVKILPLRVLLSFSFFNFTDLEQDYFYEILIRINSFQEKQENIKLELAND
jgi:hypothetical protein